MTRAFVIASLLAGTTLAGCGGAESPRQPAEQLTFGVSMAQEGLWSEAYFRFQQAARLGADDARVWNNLAVAAEALGRFDEALEHYQKALRLDPGNQDLRSNYDRFVSFYDSFRARTDEDLQEEEAGAEEGAGEPDEEPDAGEDGGQIEEDGR